MFSLIRPWLPALAIIGLAVGAMTAMPTAHSTPYTFLFDRTKAADDQQRFVNTAVRESEVSREEIEAALPRIRRVGSDLPVMLELARESKRPLSEIVELRRSGLRWQEVRDKLQLPLKPLFADVTGRMPEPYKEAWVEWRMHRKPDLSDEQIRELVLLQLAHRVTGKPVADIVKERERGQTPELILARQKADPEPVPAETKTAETKTAPRPVPAAKKDAAARPKAHASAPAR